MTKMDFLCALNELDDELISAAALTCKEENIIRMSCKKNKTNGFTRRIALVAAVTAMFAALGITAYATDVFGIKSRILDADSWFGPETAMISLAGGTESAEFKAASEWEAFETEYVNSGKMDMASLKTGYATAGDAQRAGAYFFYGCQCGAAHRAADPAGLLAPADRLRFRRICKNRKQAGVQCVPAVYAVYQCL